MHFAFHVSLAPTGAIFQNLDAAGHTYPVHRHCVATGKATLVVNSASGHASGSLEQQTLGGLRRQGHQQIAFAVLRWLPLPTKGANNRLGPFVVAFRAVLDDRLPAGRQTGCDCLAAHGSSSPSGLAPTPPFTIGRP